MTPNKSKEILKHIKSFWDRFAETRRKPKELIWTPKLVERFWDAVAESSLAELSFSLLGGRSFLIATDHLLPRDGEILDFGAGDGYLIRLMCEWDLTPWAYEISEGRIENLRKNLPDARVSKAWSRTLRTRPSMSCC